MSEKKNYNCIDLTRIICAVLVIMIHIVPLGKAAPGTVRDLINFALQNAAARIAVPFFFVTSGFFLFRKTDDARPYARRLLRLYGIWTVIYLPLIVRSLLMNEYGPVQDLILFARDTVFSGSMEFLWYLPASIFAVLLTGVLLKRKWSPERILGFAFVFYLVGLAGQSWFGVIAPLEEAVPSVWSFLKAMQSVIVTTRNGLFDAFLFVSIGMLFAKKELRIPRPAAQAGFAAGFCLLLSEAFTLRSIGFILHTDLYLSLIPTVFFGFSLALTTDLADRPVYPLLRHMSALVYFTHYWVGAVLLLFIRIAVPKMENTPLCFVLTVPLTLLLSRFLVKLSQTERFRFLKKLYS